MRRRFLADDGTRVNGGTGTPGGPAAAATDGTTLTVASLDDDLIEVLVRFFFLGGDKVGAALVVPAPVVAPHAINELVAEETPP
jgi:hypothetical protein